MNPVDDGLDIIALSCFAEPFSSLSHIAAALGQLRVVVRRMEAFLGMGQGQGGSGQQVGASVSSVSVKKDVVAASVACKQKDSSDAEYLVSLAGCDVSWPATGEEDGKDGGTTVKILSDVNVSLKSGEIYTLMGRIASGKSTLLSALLGDAAVIDDEPGDPGCQHRAASGCWRRADDVRHKMGVLTVDSPPGC